ncbi:hypothetical protein DERP_014411 [Dermatophagoides pteronyssinus]|uniref:Uncharacterized protein n=1 Tax=Dermatophagoides pteronyssinus TaxID=6956 RepID=A0ABQ8J600_DERPT|nr:hypothetical protein DERP_014411 [Dermatophagoides pteronyssinus]
MVFKSFFNILYISIASIIFLSLLLLMIIICYLLSKVKTMVLIIIHHQFTMTLQQPQQTIPCGNKYLTETIGLSITNNYLYQFLFIDNTIKIIKYDYKKLIINNIDKNNDYKLNLIDGQMLTNGLKDLIPANIEAKLMKEILTKVNKNVQSSLIMSISMSINKKGKIHIHFIKTFDQYEYTICNYNQELDMNEIEISTQIQNEKSSIMGTISNQNNGIIRFLYDKNSMNNGMELIKIMLTIDIDLSNIYQILDNPIEQEKQIFGKSFEKIIGRHLFTFGFIDNNQIFLFSNSDKIIMIFSMEIFHYKTHQKYPFDLKLYQNFFYCNNQDDEKNTENFFTIKPLTALTSKVQTIINTNIIHKTDKSINNNNNNNNDNDQSKKTSIIFGPLLLIMIIICFRNYRYNYNHKRMNNNITEQQSYRTYSIFQNPQQNFFYNKQNNTNYNNINNNNDNTNIFPLWTTKKRSQKLVMVSIFIHHQCTMTLQQQQQEEQQFLPCGKKYLRKTIGLSITDNHLYQFLLMNKKIQIIRYDYHKLFENNDENDYTLNLIDGLVLTNGLNDLIPENVVRQLMTIVLWNNGGGGGGGNEEKSTTNSDNENDIESIISMSMSINRKGKIHIHLVKTLDQYNYTIGDYNQDVNMTVMDIFYSSYPVKYNIMGTISDYNYGIITLFYNKLSYRMKIFKLKETKNFGNLSFKWQYNLIIDSVNDNLIRQIHKKPCDQEDDDGNTELKTFTKLFEQIFVLINTVVVVLIINIHHYQCTMTLQQQQQQKLQTIPCGSKYLNKTIGLSITNNHLYQFILINKTIQIIQYDNRKLLIENNDYNNDENDDYKLNLINGQMLANGLKDLIPANIAEKLMTVIQWTIEELKKYKDLHGIQEQQDNNLQPIISMSMSINKNGKIRIFCLKSFDQFIYIIGDYNQEIDMTSMEIFNVIYPEDLSIMGTISNQNDEIITFLYSKLSYQLKMIKLSEKQYGETNFEWIKSLVVDSDLKFLHEIHDEKPTEQQEETLTKSFGQIFGPHTFTYGFISDNQIYLFANQNEKLITFSMNILKEKTDEKKYPFEMKLYQKFFYCKSNENFDDFFTMEAITKITSKFETITNTMMTMVLIHHQFTMTLQLQTIPCGTKYLNQTIGLSITNNYLYQFLLINNTIQIIRYDYKKLIIKNNDNDYKLNDENDYKYNLFNGQMLSNGLNDLIPENIVKKLMKVIQWTLDESNKYKDLHNIEKQQNNNNNSQPIISMSMSINNNGKIRIYCVKSFDQFVYIIGDYNQQIDMTSMEILYYAINPEQRSIMGTISYENNGIITFIYSKLSYQIKMFKLSENSYGNQDFKSLKQLAIDESLTTIYQFNEKLDEHQQQTLTNSFGQIFGQHQFTYAVMTTVLIIINHQCTMTLQQPQQKQTISCGTKYLKETIGLSLTNNYLYQFLYMKNTIKIIKYEYKKLIKNNYHNEYRLNLIDGEVLINGLNDLIPDKIVKILLKVIQWTGEDVESNVNNSQQQHFYNNDELRQQPIISIAMSMKKNGKIRIYCLKSFDQLKYYVGDYNQEIDQTIMETFYASHKKQHIMGIISNKHFEIISFFYDKSSYRLKVFKLLPNQYGITEFKWKKSLIIDASMISIYQLEKQPNEKEKRLFYRSFSKIFGQFTFTFGFIDQKRIFLFANPDEKLLSIPYNSLQSTIQCGSRYLKQTIGISITNNYLYQFLFIDNMIQIIQYDYQKLLENIDENDDYKLNLIDGQMLVNGLRDLIPSNVVKQLMIIIQWTGNTDDDDDVKSENENKNKSPILSITMSITKNGRIRIYCLKSYDQIKYYIGYYNQEINFDKVITIFNVNKQQQIMGIISYQNEEILSIVYSKSSYCLDMLKLKENYQNYNDFEWSKQFVIDSSLDFLYEFIGIPTDEQELQTLTKLFEQIFGQHQFTYGFADYNQIFLFSNQDEILMKFSMNILEIIYLKYQFKLQPYRDFFYCNKTITIVIPQLSTTTTTNKSNDLKTTTTTTTTEPSIDHQQYPSFSIIIIIIILFILLFLSLSIEFTMTLQQQQQQQQQQLQSIPCGTKYLKETIGISVTNNQLYQFLLINETIKIIRYNNSFQRIIENWDYFYEFNLIDGQMLANGLKDLEIPTDIVEKIMTVIKWTGSDDENENQHLANDNNEPPIISIAMSINTNGKIRIYCLKTYDQLEYFVGDYNQEIYMDKIERFYGKNNIKHIMGIISYENNGIITFFYNKQSYRMRMFKLHEKHYGKTKFQWNNSFVVNSPAYISQLNRRYVIYIDELDRLKKLFAEIFEQHSFTYGFVSDNLIFLFSIHDERLISFSRDTLDTDAYAHQTIGLSITNNFLYQFLFINDTIQIIRYDYRKSIENNIDNKNNDYKLNLIDGQMLANGSEESIMDDNNISPIISISISINKNKRIRIYCLKSLDQSKYYIGDYNQEIDYDNKHYYGINNFQWTKSIMVDSSRNFLYQLDEESNEQREELTESFGEIFGQHTFTYGFVDQNQMFLFAYQERKLISFSMNIFENQEKYPFKLQSFHGFFHCDKTMVTPAKIDDNKQTTISTTAATTVKHPLSTTISKTEVNESQNSTMVINITNKSNHSEITTAANNNVPTINQQIFAIPILMIISILSIIRKFPLQQYCNGKENSPLNSMISKTIRSTNITNKSDSSIFGKSIPNSLISKTPITTSKLSGKSSSPHSMITKTPAATSKLSGKTVSSTKSKTPTTTTKSKVSGKSSPRSMISKTPTSKVSGKLVPLSSIPKMPKTVLFTVFV